MNSVTKTLDIALPCKHRPAAVRQRRGSLMVEMVVCTVLLSVVAAILAPAIHGVKRQRIANRFETLALIELNNIAAQLQANGKTEVSKIEISSWFAERYPDAELALKTLDNSDDGTLSGTRIMVSRMVFDGQIKLSRSLTTWIAEESTE